MYVYKTYIFFTITIFVIWGSFVDSLSYSLYETLDETVDETFMRESAGSTEPFISEGLRHVSRLTVLSNRLYKRLV